MGDQPRNGLGVYSTGQVARMCGVAPRTVSTWTDRGLLPCHRLPGRYRDRRVTRADLLAFLDRHGLPIPAELDGPLVVLGGCERRVIEAVAVALDGSARVAVAETLFCAGRLLPEGPRVLVLDWSLGAAACRDVGRRLGRCPAEERPALVGLLPEDQRLSVTEGYTDVLMRTADPAAVAGRVAAQLRRDG